MSKNPGTSGTTGITLGTAWQNYGLSLLFVVAIPLLPIIIEWIINGSVAEESLLITASVYGAAIAIASTMRITFGIGLGISILEATLYGFVLGSAAGSSAKSIVVAKTTALAVVITSEQSSQLRFAPLALYVIVTLIIFSALERFIRHVQNREEFFEFMK